MNTADLVIAGFGGQGVLFAGQLLAHAALDAGLQTTWMPSYGPEMRGGTANCTVVVADGPIGSPVVGRPQAVIALNLPSLDRYEPLVAPGGLLVVNASLVDRTVARTDLDVVAIPGDDVAAELGHPKLTNVVLLGALIARHTGLRALPALDSGRVAATLEHVLPERHRQLLGANQEALARGAELAAAVTASAA
ncbi:MAG: 2-oxoacid:acceptor oxidoreductase family protein [Trueperaceae bacterium]